MKHTQIIFIQARAAINEEFISEYTRPILGKIACPTLVLTGEEDRLCPPAIHREMAAQIPLSTLHIVPNCGHLGTKGHPDYVSKAMRAWLLS